MTLFISCPQPRSSEKLEKQTNKQKQKPVPNKEFWLNRCGRWAHKYLIPVHFYVVILTHVGNNKMSRSRENTPLSAQISPCPASCDVQHQ